MAQFLKNADLKQWRHSEKRPRTLKNEDKKIHQNVFRLKKPESAVIPEYKALTGKLYKNSNTL